MGPSTPIWMPLLALAGAAAADPPIPTKMIAAAATSTNKRVQAVWLERSIWNPPRVRILVKQSGHARIRLMIHVRDLSWPSSPLLGGIEVSNVIAFEKLVSWPFGQLAPGCQDVAPISVRQSSPDVLIDDEQCNTGTGDDHNTFPDSLLEARGKARRRLVEEQRHWVDHEAARDGHHMPLPTTKILGRLFEGCLEVRE